MLIRGSIFDYSARAARKRERNATDARHCVIYGMESWSGVLEWSHGMESCSGSWSGMKSDLELLLPFLDRIWF